MTPRPTARRRALLILAAAGLAAPALPPASADAQERAFPYAVGWRDAVLLPGGLALSWLGEKVEGAPPVTAAAIAELDPARVNRFDRMATERWSPAWARASDWTWYALVGAAGAVSFASPVADGRIGDAARLGAVFAESYLILRGATYTAKRLTRRTRPYAFNAALPVEERVALARADDQGVHEAFWSGHAAGAFGAAALLSQVYVDTHGRSRTSDVVWAASLSVAAFTATARVMAGKHYPSDVLVGAAVGTALGVLVPRVHRTAGEGERSGDVPLTLAFRVPVGR